MRYKADITVGALKAARKQTHCRFAAASSRCGGLEGRHREEERSFKARHPATARRLTSRDPSSAGDDGARTRGHWSVTATGGSLTHAVFAAAVKHSPLLGDFLHVRGR